MGEEIQLTYQAVGRGLVAAPTINFPPEMKFPVQEAPVQDIHFSPTFSPIFSPQPPPLKPEINIQVEPTPLNIQVAAPSVTVGSPDINYVVTIPIRYELIAIILFANTIGFVMLLFAINYFFYGI